MTGYNRVQYLMILGRTGIEQTCKYKTNIKKDVIQQCVFCIIGEVYCLLPVLL